MNDGHHGYFSAVLELTIAAALLCAVIAVARLLAGAAGARVCATLSLPALCAALAALQVVGFAALELSEGNAPDVIGYGVEILVALLVAAIVSLMLTLVEQCVIPIVTRYLRRTNCMDAAVRRSPVAFVRPSSTLAVCIGVRRFKRPPPLFG